MRTYSASFRFMDLIRSSNLPFINNSVLSIDLFIKSAFDNGDGAEGGELALAMGGVEAMISLGVDTACPNGDPWFISSICCGLMTP
jgi:hypothetical protein